MELSSDDICRVCRLNGTPERPLFHPCLCTGSIRYVHQDCLMQWLRHSQKEYCELCHYKFQFASIYRADMPKWLPINYVYKTLVNILSKKFHKWFHLFVVFIIWLYFLPVCTYRIYSLMFKGAFWSALRLPLDLITFENLILEGLMGLLIVIVALLCFVSLVWLKDQLTSGNGPEWLTADYNDTQGQNDNVNQEGATRTELIENAQRHFRLKQLMPNRKENDDMKYILTSTLEDLIVQLEEVSVRRFNTDTYQLRSRIHELCHKLRLPLNKYMFVLRGAKLKNINSVEKWRENILVDLRRRRIIHPNVGGLPSPAADRIAAESLPPLNELGLNREEQAVFRLSEVPHPSEFEDIDKDELEELYGLFTQLDNMVDINNKRQAILLRCLRTNVADYDDDVDDLTLSQKAIIERICELKKDSLEHHDDEVQLLTGQIRMVRNEHAVLSQRHPNWFQLRPEQAQQNNEPNRRRGQQQRPNIGQALIGLAREPQDPNAEAVQADQLSKMIGLDGSYQFLEHVFWMIILLSALMLVFVLVPSKVGEVVAGRIMALDHIWNDTWKILVSVFIGYLALFGAIVALYYSMALVKLYKFKFYLGMAYLGLKITILLTLEAGIFPLLCGWWMDICSFSLLGTSLKDRKESLNHAPGTVMFLHWLAGMIFVFYFASFVVLLREILRPGVLWFLRNLNDQNFHPIQDMINQPLQKHVRRFLMSNIMFGLSILVILYIPSQLCILLLPKFLPYNLTLMSNVSPIREIQLELILLQFVIPSLLEHTNTRAAMKTAIKHWSKFVSKFLHLESYLLDEPQSGGVIVDMHGNIIHYLEYDSDWEGPAYVGANEVIGPGFAPFKPYLRPSYFFLRIVSFIIITLGGFLCMSTVLLIFPVLLGRTFMGYFGIMNPPDIYTSAIGLYLLWAGMRAVNAVLVKMSAGTKAIFFHVLTWLYQIIKCTIAAGILFFIIPILLGNLVNLFIISPIRVPINRTPVVYLSTEWALGLLHMKCSCGIIWLTNTAFKQTLDQLYQNGVRNISLSMIIMQVAWPVISYLILFITIPYVFFISTFYMTGLTLYSTSVNWYRYCYGVFFVILIALSAFLIIIKQSSHVYTSIRNKEYLIGRQLMNYGSIAKEEKTSYSVAVEETGHQD